MLTFALGLLAGSFLSCVWAASDVEARWVLHVARAFLLFALVHLAFSMGGHLLEAMDVDPTRAFQLAPRAGAACAIVVLGIAVLRAFARSHPPKPSLSTRLGVYRTAALDLRPLRIREVEAPGVFAEPLRMLTLLLSLLGMLVGFVVGSIGFAELISSM
jgi:hypothetical protein